MQDRAGAAAEGYHGGYRRSWDWVGHLLVQFVLISLSQAATCPGVFNLWAVWIIIYVQIILTNLSSKLSFSLDITRTNQDSLNGPIWNHKSALIVCRFGLFTKRTFKDHRKKGKMSWFHWRYWVIFEFEYLVEFKVKYGNNSECETDEIFDGKTGGK